MEPSVAAGNIQPASKGTRDALATYDKIQNLLKAKDDTSRFVGLALMKAVLDNGQLLQDSDRLQLLWEAISPKFLDRLLRAHPSSKGGKSEAMAMVDLAVAVLHTFTILLPDHVRRQQKFLGRIQPLVQSLVQSSPETAELTLQTLLTLVSQTDGSLELLKSEDLSPLIELAPQQKIVLDVLAFAWVNASTAGMEVRMVQQSIDRIMPSLLVIFKGTDAVTLLAFFGDFLPKIPMEAVPFNPSWLQSFVTLLRRLVASRPTLAGRTAYTQLAAVLLQTYPEKCSLLLFNDDSLGDVDSKPFSYLFVNLLLIDLRSSFPLLLPQLNSDEYPAKAQRLAGAFDILSSFTGFLVRSLLEPDDMHSFKMPPDLLLKLRKDIAETMSLTVEYLRDRWDASVAGTSGLHRSARPGTTTTSEGTRLTLTWESMKLSVREDPLVLAAIRSLAIWVREDENENLHKEAIGLMDMFVELYQASSEGTLDFRDPLLTALEAMLLIDDGVEGFLGQGGWEVIFKDLQAIIRDTVNESRFDDALTARDSARGLEIVRTLLAVVDSPSITSLPEEWMTTITVTASMKPPTSNTATSAVELQIAMLQVSAALLSKAAPGVRRGYGTYSAALSGMVKHLEVVIDSTEKDAEGIALRGMLADVDLELETLRSNS